MIEKFWAVAGRGRARTEERVLGSLWLFLSLFTTPFVCKVLGDSVAPEDAAAQTPETGLRGPRTGPGNLNI